MNEFFNTNWIPLIIGIMAFAKVVVNLTPNEGDNRVFGYIDLLITAMTGDRKNKK